MVVLVTAVTESATDAPFITDPGLYPQVSFEAYLRDPVVGGSLSNSGSRKLLPPDGCPALFRHERANPSPSTRAQQFGSLVHRHVLGAGPGIRVLPFDDYKTKAAQAQRDAAIVNGELPMLAREAEKLEAMADALREHEDAAALLTPGGGLPEQTVVARDPETGVMRRTLVDWLPTMAADGQHLIVPDLKTTRSAAPEACSRSMWDYGYNRQGATIEDVLAAVLGVPVAFVLIYIETEAPHLVHVVRPDPPAMAIGRYLNRQALRLYAACSERDYWPGWTDDDPERLIRRVLDRRPTGVSMIGVPAWVERLYEGVI